MILKTGIYLLSLFVCSLVLLSFCFAIHFSLGHSFLEIYDWLADHGYVLLFLMKSISSAIFFFSFNFSDLFSQKLSSHVDLKLKWWVFSFVFFCLTTSLWILFSTKKEWLVYGMGLFFSLESWYAFALSALFLVTDFLILSSFKFSNFFLWAIIFLLSYFYSLVFHFIFFNKSFYFWSMISLMTLLKGREGQKETKALLLSFLLPFLFFSTFALGEDMLHSSLPAFLNFPKIFFFSTYDIVGPSLFLIVFIILKIFKQESQWNRLILSP